MVRAVHPVSADLLSRLSGIRLLGNVLACFSPARDRATGQAFLNGLSVEIPVTKSRTEPCSGCGLGLPAGAALPRAAAEDLPSCENDSRTGRRPAPVATELVTVAKTVRAMPQPRTAWRLYSTGIHTGAALPAES